MGHVSIYRQYRPIDFTSVVGQEHIVRILSNQIRSGRIGHAYLFTGTRGTGKTSIAKIFAKAINCINPVNGSACGECEACKTIAERSCMDIIEIDAASNNGVDEIRELRESVKYMPASLKYKVYIIDEVHMLSGGAFNALLKTLEEPPSHVVFILATTEVRKLPQTILSRCLRFDFRLVPSAQIAGRIKYIFSDMGVEYTDEAIAAIAEAGDGSVRDALSIADMCISFSEGKVSYEDVLEVLGASNPNSVIEMIESMLSGKSENALNILSELSDLGKSMNMLAKDLAKMLRNLYIVKTCEFPDRIIGMPAMLTQRLEGIKATGERILQCMDIFTGVESEMKYSSLPRIMLESAIIRAGDAKANIDLNGIINRLKTLEAHFSGGEVPVSRVSTTTAVRRKREYSPQAVCGYLIKTLRERDKLMLYAEVSVIDPHGLKLSEDGVLTIKITGENNVAMLTSPQNLSVITEIITGEFAGINDVKILEQVKKDKDIASDMEIIRAMFDKDIINITKGGK